MPKKGENIYKRKDGRWEGRYIRLRNIGGKAEYGYIYGKSYAEVKKKLMNAKVAVQLHAETREKSLGTYGQLLDDWLHSSKITVKDSTYARYTHLVQKHIKPHLGYLQSSQLTSQIVEDFIVSRLKAGRLDGQGGLAPKTVTDILTVIKSTIGYAKCSNYDVCCNLKRLSVKKGDVEMRVLTHTEQAALTRTVLDNMDLYKFGVLLAGLSVAFAGMSDVVMALVSHPRFVFHCAICAIHAPAAGRQCQPISAVGAENISDQEGFSLAVQRHVAMRERPLAHDLLCLGKGGNVDDA